jgi:ribulose-phosphate 3-epimerase
MASAPAPATERFNIIPSVLPADYARLGEELQALEKAGVDRVQWDVMDGVFVPNLTFGPDVIKAVRSWVDTPFEAHLMVVNPDTMLDKWVEAGCEMVIVHAETCTHLHRTLASIREMGAKPAVALNPATPVEAVKHVVDLLDLLLVMTVNPGFGGQAYIATMEPKIAEAAALLRNADHYVELEVDGGIGPNTIAGAAKAGARALIAGSALYKDPEGLEHAVSDLRARARAACPGVE